MECFLLFQPLAMSSSESDSGEPLVTLGELRKKTIRQLQEELKKKGLPHSAKNKEILVKRLFRKLNALDTSSESGLDSDSDGEPEEITIPAAHTLQDWTTVETQNVPNLQEKDVLNYYSFHKHPHTGSSLNFANMLKKAKKLSNENYLRDLIFHPINDIDFCYFKGKCKASMRDCTYNVTLCLSKSMGTIQSALCSCKAGLSGVCCHVGAMLFYLVMMKAACTNIGCAWLQPQGTSQAMRPKRFSDVQITNTANSTALPSVKPYPGVYRAGPCADPDKFLLDCLEGLGKVNPTCVLFQVMCNTVPNILPFTNIFCTLYKFADNVNLSDKVDELMAFVDSLNVPLDVCNMLEKATRGQHANAFWQDARSHLITASNFGNVVKRKSDTPPDNLVKRLCQYVPFKDTKPMAYGRKMESKALKHYAQEHMKSCKSLIEVKNRGLQVNPQYPFLGASVDGIVMCEQCGTGVVEVKCPYKWRQTKPIDCCNDSDFCCTIMNGEVSLKSNHNYLYQVMGQMAIVDLKWADFVIWTKKGIHIQRIPFSVKIWDYMLRKLHAFYLYGMVAEFYSNRVKRQKALYPE
jgi:hypothetical protein